MRSIMKIVFESVQEFRYFLASSFSEIASDRTHRKDRFIAASQLVAAVGDDLSLDFTTLDLEDLRYLHGRRGLARRKHGSPRLSSNGRSVNPALDREWPDPR